MADDFYWKEAPNWEAPPLEKTAYDFAAAAKSLSRFKELGRTRLRDAYSALFDRKMLPLTRPRSGDAFKALKDRFPDGRFEGVSVSPKGRKHLEAIIQQHELDELVVPRFGGGQLTGKKALPMWYGHNGPDVILREHNRLVTSPPEVREEVTRFMKTVRQSDETPSIANHVPGFNYGETPRLSRHARRRIVQVMADKEVPWLPRAGYADIVGVRLDREARLAALRKPGVRDRIREFAKSWQATNRQAPPAAPKTQFTPPRVGGLTDRFWQRNAELRFDDAQKSLKSRLEDRVRLDPRKEPYGATNHLFNLKSNQEYARKVKPALKKFEGG